MLVFKIAVIGVGGSLLSLIVGQCRKEYGTLVLLAVSLFLLAYVSANLNVMLEFLKELGDRIEISSRYLRVLFKILAIAYLCQISSNLCQDMGYRALSFQIDVIGKLSVLMLSVPILNSLLDAIDGFL